MSFVHLHTHTEYSLLDGAIKIKDLIKKAIEFNMPAVTITDHGNMFGVIDFYNEAKKQGIKPVIGCEVYIAKGSRFQRGKKKGSDEVGMNHLILLAKNNTGYENLMALSSLAYIEGFYYKPRIDIEILEKYSEGLIALSSCLKGAIPEAFLNKGEAEAEKILENYLKIFKEDFFIELMVNGIPEQQIANEYLIDLARKRSLGVVATNDCHYLDKDMVESHDVLLCIQTGKTLNDKDRMKFSTGEFYFKSPEEMSHDFADIEEAVSNTVFIADKCNVDLEFGKYQFPVIPLKKGETVEEVFEKKSIEGFKNRLPQIKILYNDFNENIEKKYWERLYEEISMIKQMGFAGYFLIVQDFITYAKDNNIPVGPGRGSAAGSLVAYALQITDINPIPYNLLFERFLNPERISMPDIDIDFCNRQRDKVIEYVTNKYGRDKVSQIITFGQMKARAVVRDVGRVLNVPYKEVDRIAKMIPATLNITLEQALKEEKELRELAEKDETVKKIIDISKHLEGLARHASIHAAGIVIGNKPLIKTVPLATMKEGEVVTQYNMKHIESVGLIKFDFLGLKTLTVIDEAVKLIRKNADENFDINTIPLNDKKTYKLFSSGNTIGVFQLESSGIRELIKRLKPDKFEDVIALVALYRPGPLKSGMVDEFIDVKHGKKKANYALPVLKPILEDTYGIILYQEQVMQIAQVLGGYTLGQADMLRRAMGKKIASEMEKQKSIFLDGCKKNNVPLKIAEDIFDKMSKFAEYGFNKSHSAAYAYIAYQTAYLKAHFPVEFMTALLTEDKDNSDKVIKDINECKTMGIDILPPDINESELDFTVVGKKIRFGLGAIKNVGTKAISSIIANREKEKYKSLYDFCYKVDLNKVNKKVIESLIKSGAMDELPLNRATKFSILEKIMEKAVMAKKEKQENAIGIFGAVVKNEPMELKMEIDEIPDWSEQYKLKLERELLGFYISSNPLNRYQKLLDDYSTATIDDILSGESARNGLKLGGIITDIKIIKTKRKSEKMASIILEDLTGKIEVIIFPKLFSEREHLIKLDNMVFIKGNLDSNENGVKIILNEIIPINEVNEKFTNKVILSFSGYPAKEAVVELKRKLSKYKSNSGKHELYFKINIIGKGEIFIHCPSFKIGNIEAAINEINGSIGNLNVILE